MLDASAAPTVSVIIPVYNDLDRLTLCLDALAEQTWPAASLEIIVCDNGSDSPIAPALVRWPNVRTVFQAQPGSYVARNTALEVAKGDYYAFTDSDCIPEPDWVAEGVAALRRNPKIGFLGGQVRIFAEDPDRPRLAEQYELVCAFDQERYAGLGFSVTANLFVRAKVMREVGAFDPTLRSSGDHEWGRKATREGHVGAYCAGAVVRHPARKTLAALRKKARRVVGGRNDAGRQRNVWIELSCSVFPRVGRMRRVFSKRGKGFTLRQRSEAALVRMFIEYFKAWEGMRLRMGGQRQR